MDHMDNFRERFEALERRTQMVEQRLRWWRGIACGVIMLGLLTWALPSGKAADAPGRGMAERMATLEKKLAAMDFDDAANEVVISGANLRIVNGLGSTETTNGLGNLIVGYNEGRRQGGDTRTGSHNIVVGTEHNFSSFAGLVVGDENEISGPFASVSGGEGNIAAGRNSSISGGFRNRADGRWGSISGGDANLIEERSSIGSISGGGSNTVSGATASISGGLFNLAFGSFSSISGGQENLTPTNGFAASISGGSNIRVDTNQGWAAGSFGGEISGSFRSP